VRDAIAGHLRERGEAVGIAQLGGFEEPGARLAESPRLHFARGQVLCRVTVAGVRGEHRRLAAGFAAGDSISTSSMGWTSRSPMVAASVTWIALVRLVHRGLTNLVRPPRSPRRTRQPRLLDRYWFYLGH